MSDMEAVAGDGTRSVTGIFGVPSLEPTTMLMGLVADMSAIRASSADTTRRLGAIERHTTSIASAMDKTAETLTKHELRIGSLEKDLIQNGELRMQTLEKVRTRAIGLIIAALTSCAGWFVVTYLVPLIKPAAH